MAARHLPVRPDLDSLQRQAEDLLRLIRDNDPSAIQEFNQHHPEQSAPETVQPTQVREALARSYGVPGWQRLVEACELTGAIWRDDAAAVRAIILQNPRLLHECVTVPHSNWGPPMTYAANLGRDGIIRMLHEMGAADLESASARALLQSQTGTARMLHAMMGSPPPPADALGGPAYTLSVAGTALLLELGAAVCDSTGRRLAPVDVVLESDSRDPPAKHQILELYVRHGLEMPDTPVMALHRGRIDLLEQHLRRDPQLLRRTFRHEEIYPPALGCHDEVLATQGTPLAGTGLLHMCVDFDEVEIARWLVARGIDVNLRGAVDSQGFGGHTALFCTVVSQPNFWMNHSGKPQVAPLAELLLDHGANPNLRASLSKQLHPGYSPQYDVSVHEYRGVTALAWGRRFHAGVFVSQPALRLIAERGGRE